MSAITPSITHRTTTTSQRRWFDVFIRMIWKELRVLSPFWFVVVIAMNGLSGIVVWMQQGEPSTDNKLLALASIAVLFPLLYAIGLAGCPTVGGNPRRPSAVALRPRTRTKESPDAK